MTLCAAWSGLALPLSPTEAHERLSAGAPRRSATSVSLNQPATAAPRYVSRQLIVRWRSDSPAGMRADVRRRLGSRRLRVLPVRGLELVRLPAGQGVESAEAAFERTDAVVYAEPNYVYPLASTVPNDPRFLLQWGLHNSGQTVNGVTGRADADIDAPEAWDVARGNAAVTVAVVDTGVADDHPDLIPNLWRNPQESGGGRETNRTDDDGNGYVDDVLGWDFVDGDNSPRDSFGHGTFVAGIAGATGNNASGVTGVSWRLALMTLRAGPSATLDVASAAAGFAYAAGKGARAVNASFGGPIHSQALLDAINAFPQVLFVTAAGNGGGDGIGDDNDLRPTYPCSYPAPNVLCVTATDQEDALAGFSNYGATTVDLGAPGVNILTTQTGGGDRVVSGTSMATPFVTGAAALLWAASPGASAATVKEALLQSVDATPSLSGRTVTGGRLNVDRALRLLPRPTPLRHARAVSFALQRHVVATGRVTVADGFGACSQNVPVKLQRRVDDRWVTLRTLRTAAAGRYSARLRDRPGLYRAQAAAVAPAVQGHICSAATSPTRRHRH